MSVCLSGCILASSFLMGLEGRYAALPSREQDAFLSLLNATLLCKWDSKVQCDCVEYIYHSCNNKAASAARVLQLSPA